MFRFLPFLLLFFACFLLPACQRDSTPPAAAFYYWKTGFEMDSTERAQLDRFAAGQPIYLRLFDVDYSAGYGGAVPVGEVSEASGFDGRPVVPVVFITNRVFTQLKPADVDSLAGKIAKKIGSHLDDLAQNAWWSAMAQANDSLRSQMEASHDSFFIAWKAQNVPEIQLDCDWTASTRDAYFRLLRTFKKQTIAQHRVLSCTIRLHQYRDRASTGVPPVERGMLMCYNVASPRDTATRNAIFDLKIAENYLKDAKKYPLPLDVALPVFSWGAWFRDGEFRGLLSAWDDVTPSDTSYFTALPQACYRLRRDTVWGNNYLREGDVVRLDMPSEQELIAAPARLKRLVRPGGRVLFFDWDTKKIEQYERLIPKIMAGF